jgi:hypothetical protein
MSTVQDLQDRIRPGWAHYHADVEWRTDREIKNAAANTTGRRIFTTLVVHANSADHALRQVHETLQKAKENNTNREVVRPMLLPSEYAISRLFIPYKDSTGEPYERTFDLPAGENPTVAKEKVEPVKPEPMPFFEETKGQGRLAETPL